MGRKTPDQIHMAEWRRHHETVGEMLAKGWEVRSQCQTCGLPMQVNLRHLIKLEGPRLSLWDTHPKCRKLNCGGRVKFTGKPPGAWKYRPLDSSHGAEEIEARDNGHQAYLDERK